jgi:hypothetical protein
MTTARGLLIEGVGENLLRNSILAGSDPISNWSAKVSGSRVPLSSLLGFGDGAQAWVLTATSQRPFFESDGLTLAASTDYVLSFWVEQFSFTGGSNIIARIENAGSGATGIDLLASAVPSALPARVAYKFRTGTNPTAGGVRVRIGLGAFDVATGTMTFSRPQLELGQTSTSFMPSASGPGSRAADVVIKGTNLFPYNPAEGSWVMEFRTPRLFGAEGVIFQMDGGSEATRISHVIDTTGRVRLIVTNNGTQVLNLDGGAVTANSRCRSAIRYGASDWALSVNGAAPVKNASVAVPSGLTMLRRGHGVAGRPLNSELSMLSCYRSKRSDATLQADSTIATTPTTQRTIWIYNRVPGWSNISQSVRDAYNAKPCWTIYQAGIDKDNDGIYDGSEFSSRIAEIPVGSTAPCSLDWETIANAAHYPGGNQAICLGQCYGNSEASQDICERESIRGLNAYRAGRPTCPWGMYDVPRSNGPHNFAYPGQYNFEQFQDQYNQFSDNFLTYLDYAFPRAYVSTKEYVGSSPPDTAGEIWNTHSATRAQMTTMYGNMARLSLRVSERTNWRIKVAPYFSFTYYAGTASFNQTEAPQEWVHFLMRTMLHYTYNGRKIADQGGMTLWHGGSSAPINESHLKTMYQALHNMSYNPSMARP